MSIRKARRAFETALQQAETKSDPVMEAMLEGLVELAKGLEDDLHSLKNEIRAAQR